MITPSTQTRNSFDAITSALQFEYLTGEEQEELLLEINSIIFHGSLVRLLERMDENTREAFNELIDSDPTEELMEEFLMTHVPDANKAVEESVDELTSDILALTIN